MQRLSIAAAVVGSLLLAAGAAGAQNATPQSGAMPGMQHEMTGAPPDGPASASSAAFKAADEKMMRGMDVPLTGDTDKDFVNGMIPHHQGAIDMAEVELRYGRDPKLKQLARDIIAAQKKEIAFMERWRKEHAR